MLLFGALKEGRRCQVQKHFQFNLYIFQHHMYFSLNERSKTLNENENQSLSIFIHVKGLKRTVLQVFGAASRVLLLRGLQKEEQTVEGKQELSLLMEEKERVCVLPCLWEDPGQAVNTQLTRHVPQTQNLWMCKSRCMYVFQINKQDSEEYHVFKIRSSDYKNL